MNKILLIILLVTSTLSIAGEREKVVQNYTNFIGIREATGNNDGKEVAMFLMSTGLDEGYAWCAAFVNYCLEQAGVKTVKSAWSPSWFPTQYVIYQRGKHMTMQPQPGDVFGIYFEKKKRIAHVGFIHQWSNGAGMVTVEGNTNEAGSREGDGVYRKFRLKSQIYSISNWIDL